MTTTIEKDRNAADVEHLALKIGVNTKHEIKNAFDYLIEERKNWQENEYVRSNVRLYQILQQCYALYQEMKGVSAEKLAMKRAFNSYCTDSGVNFNDSTHLMVKIVRCVFGDDRRRVSAYALALRIADEHKTSVLDIPKYFTEAGGYEEVRRNNTNKAAKADKKAQGLSLMNSASLASVTSDALNAVFDEGNYEGAVLLMSTREPDGSFQVKYVIQQGNIITSALSHLVTLTKDVQEKLNTELKAANDESIRTDAINQVVNA
jgi:hypothetical protein